MCDTICSFQMCRSATFRDLAAAMRKLSCCSHMANSNSRHLQSVVKKKYKLLNNVVSSTVTPHSSECFTLKMEALILSRTLLNLYRFAARRIPDDDEDTLTEVL
jgi:hypothetical protein